MNQTTQQRRAHVGKAKSGLSINRQCKLLDINRSGIYYKSVPESALNIELMRLIDEKNMKHPWLGVPRITTWLRKDKGYVVNHKRIERLFKLMGISAIYPKPNTSKPGKGHKIYPYLLRNLSIDHSNQVWALDITYIPVRGGYLYLVAVIDIYSRYVLNWSLSNTMTTKWCKDVLEEAVCLHGAPQIVNTDQGSQFTAFEFSNFVVEDMGVKLSMDGKGRAIDNIFIERLWRSLKYEHVYLYPASDGLECYQGIRTYFDYYNQERRHQSLQDETPQSVYNKNKKLAA